MKPRIVFWMTLVLLLVFVAIGLSQAQGPAAQAPMGTVFTYQGRLNDGGNPANGTYDFEFKLYDAVSGGAQVGSTVTKEDVAVSRGLFAVELDFGAVFDGTALWLEVGVKGEGETEYTTLSPLQALTPTPYALYAATAANASELAATAGGVRLQGGSQWGGPNIIGGSYLNSVATGLHGATIGGGGGEPIPQGGYWFNSVGGDYGTVGGGSDNHADGLKSTVSGGWQNTASDFWSTVGGGHGNTASGAGATVAGGSGNAASAGNATVGGGEGNTASRWFTTIGGGADNTASVNYATVGGGYENTAAGEGATVGGGHQNVVSGTLATVPGGKNNTAGGDYSFAAGRGAKALHDGSFVWADTQEWQQSEAWELASTDENQFRVRAGGGVSFDTTEVWHEQDGHPHTGPGGGTHFNTTSVTIDSGFGSLLRMEANWWEYSGFTHDELSPSIVFGYSGNSASCEGATVSGGGGSFIYTNPSGEWYASYPPRPNRAFGSFSTVSGGLGNTAGPEDFGPPWMRLVVATVAGGMDNTASAHYATVGGGSNNNATDYYGTVGGGGGNRAGNGDEDTENATHATVSGGKDNTASATYSAISGGSQNTISASGYGGTIGGGLSNQVENQFSTVGGGEGNSAGGSHSTVGGGKDNAATGGYATVAGGKSNWAGHLYAAVGGGRSNEATGESSTVPGGADNIAQGAYSFAAGSGAQANHMGSFVWADSSGYTPYASTGDNQFRAQAAGGVYFHTNPIASTGVRLAPGGSSWLVVSDRAVKENFAPIDSRDILEKVAAMPIESWNLKSQDASIRHIGPVAQDFYAAFGYGESDTAINMEDAHGVALSAIQGLYEIVQEQKGEIETLKEQNADLEARLSALEAAVNGGAAKASPVSLPTGLLPGAGVLVACLGLVWLTRKGGGR